MGRLFPIISFFLFSYLGNLADTYSLSLLGNNGLFMVAFGLAVELVGQKYKTLVGMLFNVPYSLGEVALGAVAAAGVRNWRNLHIAFGVPAFVMLALTWFIPESPRWLIATKKFEQAEKLLQKAAAMNKVRFFFLQI